MKLNLPALDRTPPITIPQAIRKLERLRLRGVWTPTKDGPNRKQRRAERSGRGKVRLGKAQ